MGPVFEALSPGLQSAPLGMRVVHANVRKTGRRVLYVNPEFTCRFEGWTRRESLPLLRYLFDFAVRPEFVTRFSWAPAPVPSPPPNGRQRWHRPALANELPASRNGRSLERQVRGGCVTALKT